MRGGTFEKNLITIQNFKDYAKIHNYDATTEFFKNGVLSNTFSLDEPVVKDMVHLLKHNLIQTITIGDIINDVYKLQAQPIMDDVDFLSTPTKITEIDELINIKPNDSFEWNGFLFKFYDFNIKSHEKYKSQFNISELIETCGKKISESYLKYSLETCDYLITVSDSQTYILNKDHDTSMSDVYAFSMNNTLNYGTSLNTYTSTTCSTTLTNDAGEKILSFGLLLRYIMLKYLKSIGFVNAYNDASTFDLLAYYTRWNYRLGKGLCEVDDNITDRHKELISQGNKEAINSFYEELTASKYNTNTGYRMKLCGINLDGWLEYLKKSMSGIKERLEADYDSIYYYFKIYKDKQNQIKMQTEANEKLDIFRQQPIETQQTSLGDLFNILQAFDNKRIYEIVIELVKTNVLKLESLNDTIMTRIKTQVSPGPYMSFMKNIVIKQIKAKEQL
jgi:hypothetical protein